MVDRNIRQPKKIDPANDEVLPEKVVNGFGRVFISAYGTSLVIAFTVASAWLTVVHGIIPGITQQTPDVAKLGTLFVATIPSILTCACYSLWYCSVDERNKNLKFWPAILFGFLSGLIFNMMTEITLIEYLFDW